MCLSHTHETVRILHHDAMDGQWILTPVSSHHRQVSASLSKMQYLHFRFHATIFILKDSWRNSKQSMLFHNLRRYLPYQTYVHTTFYHSWGLTRNLMFNGSIYHFYIMQILCFYLVRQTWSNFLQIHSHFTQSLAFGQREVARCRTQVDNNQEWHCQDTWMWMSNTITLIKGI